MKPTFVQDEFMATAGEFAAQIFIQTWFLRRKRGLRPPKDRRCIDFTRLVIMCCDLARLGDYELLANLWTCVLHRFVCVRVCTAHVLVCVYVFVSVCV